MEQNGYKKEIDLTELASWTEFERNVGTTALSS